MTSTTDKPFITIAISTYNYGIFLKKAVEAIVCQSYKDYEIIIVDDGSTDDTAKIAHELIELYTDSSIRYIYKENGGAASTRNAALDAANGTYLYFHDGDDWIEPGALELLANVARDTSADRIYSELQLRDEDDKLLEIQKFPRNPSKWTFSSSAATLYKHELFQKHDLRWIEGMFSEDIYINFLFASYSKTNIFINQPTYNWVQHSKSTSAPNSKVALRGKEMLQEIIENSIPIYERLMSSEDKVLMEYEIIKMYVICILRSLRTLPYKEMLRRYYDTHDYFLGKFNKYKSNKYIYNFRSAPVRKWTHTILSIFVTCEKLHIAWLMLLGYKLLSRVYTFKF